ncbi:MAG: crossover junction endodeoxyribonuclease RuvC [Candidatus Eisenbacteria bacterium]|nr:crossover junction endodeoxyribonuclease RuvC [Candidatus Eisenbacteria bacterium]
MKSWRSLESSGQAREFTVLGIDPGSLVTGYGLIHRVQPALECLDFGCVRLPPEHSLTLRLEQIYDKLSEIVAAFKPDRMAVETIFHSRSARSALIMGHVRGVVLLVAAKAGLEIFEYTPLEIKLSVVGTGAASKKQVQFMVSRILSISGKLPLDASDALAVALCHVNKCARGHYSGVSRVGASGMWAALGVNGEKSAKGGL